MVKKSRSFSNEVKKALYSAGVLSVVASTVAVLGASWKW